MVKVKENKENKDEEVIQTAIDTLEKKYGKNTVTMIGNKDFKVEWLEIDSFLLNSIIGGPGLPRARMIEIAGKEAGGKTTLSLFLIAQIQKRGGRAAFIDAEHSFNSEYTKGIGVDISKLFLAQPSSLEESFDVLRELVNTKKFDLIVLDSVAALAPKAEIEEEEMLKTTVALRARLMSKALSILSGEIASSKTTVIFINQIRDKIGVFYGAKTVTPGGRALKFYSSVRLDVSNGKKIVEKEKQIGNEMVITAVKNKVGSPWGKVTLNLFYGKGIDLNHDLLTFGEQVEIIKKTGNTYSFKGESIGVGKEKAIEALKDNKVLFEKIKTEIKKYLETNNTKNDDQQK